MACSQNVWRFDGKLRSALSFADADIQFTDRLPAMGSHRRIKRAGVIKSLSCICIQWRTLDMPGSVDPYIDHQINSGPKMNPMSIDSRFSGLKILAKVILPYPNSPRMEVLTWIPLHYPPRSALSSHG